MEKDAYGVGAAALVPWEMLLPDMNRGAAIDELAELSDVTTDLITYRIKIRERIACTKRVSAGAHDSELTVCSPRKMGC